MGVSLENGFERIRKSGIRCGAIKLRWSRKSGQGVKVYFTG